MVGRKGDGGESGRITGGREWRTRARKALSGEVKRTAKGRSVGRLREFVEGRFIASMREERDCE